MFVCSECNQTLSSRPSLRRHTFSVHQVKLPNLRPGALLCASCSEKFSCHEDFTKHLRNIHDVIASVERRKFDSEPEFQDWLRCIENSEPVKFIIKHTERSEKRKVKYYQCNRSGPVKIRVNSEERKRGIKALGSRKINAYCPARITATFLTDGSVDVTFCLTHFGHKLAAAHIPLPSSVKQIIAEKISAQVPLDSILTDVKTSLSGKISRVRLLNNQDLKNVIRDYKLHSDDATSVDQWVKKERSVEGANNSPDSHESASQNDISAQLVLDIDKREEDSRQIVNSVIKPNSKTFEEEKKGIMETFKAELDSCNTKVEMDVIRETLHSMRVKLAAARRRMQAKKY